MSRPFNDLSGQKIGNLLVVDRAKNDERGQACWNCVCDCGKKIVASTKRLIDKKSPKMHCGCLSSQHRGDALKGKKHRKSSLIDLTGQTLGHLFILNRAGWDKCNNALYLAQCVADNCGKEIIALGSEMTRKRRPKTHCGCLTKKHHADAGKIYIGVKANGYKHGQSKTLEYAREGTHRRRIKIKKTVATISAYEGLLKASRSKLDYCAYCGSIDNLSTDHIIPIDKSGNQDSKNLVTACMSCNASKSNLFFIDWYLKTKRCKRSLIEIIADMNFDSIFHLQHYQDSICTDYYEKNRSSVVAKILKAEKKSIKLLDRFYKSLDNYPTH